MTAALPAAEHEVVIVGGGPVGQLLAIELGRRGIDVRLIERRSAILHHPRAIGIHPRTMEIFRQLGFADGVRDAGNLPLAQWRSVGFITRLTGHEFGQIDVMGEPDVVEACLNRSPELITWCAQDLLEPFLREQNAALPTVTATYGVRMTALARDESGVTVSVVDDAGATSDIRAAYVVGADGVRSAVRAQLEIPYPGTPTMSDQLNVCFRADLSPYLDRGRCMMWWVVNPDTQGALLAYDGVEKWVYSWNLGPGETAADYPTERVVDVVRSVIGVPDLEVAVLGMFPWAISAQLADRFRSGRALLVGDAAHVFPPIGGFGMNSGLQDAQNLGWKLAAVVRGTAGAGLLDTYAAERRAVAEANIQQTLQSAQLSRRASWLSYDQARLVELEKPEATAARQEITDSLPALRSQYWSYGQQFGMVYVSDAVVDDGSDYPVSTTQEYHPTAHPGAHAPHVWITTSAGERRSTIDVLHSRFVVLTTPAGQAWITAASRLAAETGWELAAFAIGDGAPVDYVADGGPVDYVADGGPVDYVAVDRDFAATYGIGPTGAVLVRPDGHVAFRAAALGDEPAIEMLRSALDRVLDIAAPSAVAGPVIGRRPALDTARSR